MNEFLNSMAVLLSSGAADEYSQTRRDIDAALGQAWKASRQERFASKEVQVNISFVGSATTYIKLRSRYSRFPEASTNPA
jgi:hypothetical protein